jgi:hypothetical protein
VIRFPEKSGIFFFPDARQTLHDVVLRHRHKFTIVLDNVVPIRHPYIRMKHCAYGHSVATLLNPRGVTTVSHKYSLTVASMRLW